MRESKSAIKSREVRAGKQRIGQTFFDAFDNIRHEIVAEMGMSLPMKLQYIGNMHNQAENSLCIFAVAPCAGA